MVAASEEEWRERVAALEARVEELEARAERQETERRRRRQRARLAIRIYAAGLVLTLAAGAVYALVAIRGWL